MSTPREISIQKKNFEARRSSRITHHQSGYLNALRPGGHLQLAAAAVGGGWLPSEDNVEADPNDWRNDVTGAIDFIQQAIDKSGNDAGLNDALVRLLRTCDVLVKVPNGSLVRKAKVNVSGTTSGPLNVSTNEAAKRGGAGLIDVARWSQETPAWIKLAEKYPAIFEAANE